MRNIFNSRFSRVLRFFCAAMFLPLSGCQTEDLDAAREPVVAKGQIELSFKSVSDIDSRSSLNGSHVNYRTVKNVWVLIFKGVGHSATLVHTEDVKWIGDISQTYRLTSKLDEGTYTLLAIGTDDKAGATYQLPEGIAVGTTLQTTQASLAAGKTADDMAHADFYVAQKQIIVHATTGNLVSMTLRRRESGVQVYLKNIPYEINHEGTNYRVKTLRVRLHDNQRTSILLFDPRNDTPGESDRDIWEEMCQKYISGSGSLENSSTLMTFDVSEYERSEDGNFFAIPVLPKEEVRLENTLYGGAFLLPMAAPSSPADNTLVIELSGSTTLEGETDSGEEEVLKTYVVKLKKDDGASLNNYPLEGNHLYSVGKKLSSETTDGDEPVDLQGAGIEIYTDDYDLDYVGEIDFPNVDRQPALIHPDFPASYIFDCIHTIETIKIDPPFPDKSATWQLTIEMDENNTGNTKHWMHFVVRDEKGTITGYTDRLTGKGGREVEVLINDYVERQDMTKSVDERIADRRRGTLRLVTTGQEWKPVELPIQQYNAFMIKSSQPEPGYEVYFYEDYGISRLDYGAEFPREEGTPSGVPIGTTVAWGYYLSDATGIYGAGVNYIVIRENGFWCHKRAKDAALDGYKDSALETAYLDAVEMVPDGEVGHKNAAVEMFWLMPAIYQWQDIFNPENNMSPAQWEALNFSVGDIYWSSSMSSDLGWMGAKLAQAMKAGTKGIEKPERKNDPKRIRQVRHYKK